MRSLFRPGLALLVVGPALCAAALIGCDAGGGHTCCPECGTGFVEGYLLGGGRPVGGAAIRFYPRRAAGGMPHGSVRTDTAGWFRAELPCGAYLIQVKIGDDSFTVTPAGFEDWTDPRDSLTVAAGTRRFDIEGGALQVAWVVPATLRGAEVRCGLKVAGEGYNPSHYQRAIAATDTLIFDFPLLAPGAYEVALAPDLEGDYWLPGTRNLEHAAAFTVGTSAPCLVTDAPPPTVRLEGRVLGSWQALGLQRPVLVGVSADSSRLFRIATDRDGAFELELCYPEPFRLSFSIGRLARWWGGDDFDSATRFDAQPGEAIPPIEYLESGFACRWEPPLFSTQDDILIAITRADGRPPQNIEFIPQLSNPIAVANLAPGDYYLRIRPSFGDLPWCAQWYPGVPEQAAAHVIAVPPHGGVAQVEMTLSPCSCIAGRVWRADCSPAARCEVRAMRHVEGEAAYPDEWYRTMTTHAGDYTLCGLPAGEYTILADVDGDPDWYPGTGNRHLALPILVGVEDRIEGIEWVQGEMAP